MTGERKRGARRERKGATQRKRQREEEMGRGEGENAS